MLSIKLESVSFVWIELYKNCLFGPVMWFKFISVSCNFSADFVTESRYLDLQSWANSGSYMQGYFCVGSKSWEPITFAKYTMSESFAESGFPVSSTKFLFCNFAVLQSCLFRDTWHVHAFFKESVVCLIFEGFSNACWQYRLLLC